MNKLITRKQYMAGEHTHAEYYAQFGRDLVAMVSLNIGQARILASEDPHFNDIPLRNWDNLAGSVRMLVGDKIAAANETGGISLSDCVCAAKSAAHIIREQAQ
jgi:hypothetical protein